MPLYEYTCTRCETSLTVRATVAEKAAGLAPACEACGSPELRQRFRAAGLIGTSAAPATSAPPIAGCGPAGCGPVGC